MAFGSGAVASQTNAMAFGTNAQATGANAIAIGNGATATGSIAVGNGALASNGGAAFGDNSTASGTNSTATGPGATATHANAAAFGNGATTTRANQHVYGTASNTHTMPGIASAASRAAQSGPTQIVTSDAAGNLAATPFSAIPDVAAINRRLDQVSGQADKAVTGVAMAFAMAGVPTLLPNERMAATLNVGTYEGSQGFAINAAWRVAENVQFNGGVAYGPNENIVGGRAGLRVGW
jgi:autotransporter adhesin